jgi:hypothetical protein
MTRTALYAAATGTAPNAVVSSTALYAATALDRGRVRPRISKLAVYSTTAGAS